MLVLERLSRAAGVGLAPAVFCGYLNLVRRLMKFTGWLAPARMGTGAGGACGFALTALAIASPAFTGWLGGELAFRHRVGVSPKVGGDAKT